MTSHENLSRTTHRHVPTVVIGAGQTGLSTAYFLTRAGHECLVVHEHDRVGDQWRQRDGSLRLNTPAKGGSVPGTPCRSPPRRSGTPCPVPGSRHRGSRSPPVGTWGTTWSGMWRPTASRWRTA